jgi:hypothetical protein
VNMTATNLKRLLARKEERKNRIEMEILSSLNFHDATI